MGKLGKIRLRRIRNEIEIGIVIKKLGITWKIREGYFRYLCPSCGEFHTATNSETNLARCFTCSRNFNPIDMAMAVKGCDFLAAVRYLEETWPLQGDEPHQ